VVSAQAFPPRKRFAVEVKSAWQRAALFHQQHPERTTRGKGPVVIYLSGQLFSTFFSPMQKATLAGGFSTFILISFYFRMP
jgi:hypothetical protein